MKISDSELRAFANCARNKIELGQCDRNSYKFYKKYSLQGAEIFLGKADFYRLGEFIGNDFHYWNVIKSVDASGKELTQIVDIYNYKSQVSGEYCNHEGESESFNSFIEGYKINLRFKQNLIRSRRNKGQSQKY